MGAFPYASETLHIALLSLPQQKEGEHTQRLIDDLYSSYYRDMADYSAQDSEVDNHLYKPLKYYILGNYDIALVSLINNYKFAQKQLTPRSAGKDGDAIEEPNSYQVITGSCPIIDKNFSPKKFFLAKQNSGESFICISNLKINNKLLIGNGYELFEKLLYLLDDIIRKEFKVNAAEVANNYFLQQSYSWFEISLVLFSEKIGSFSKILNAIRALTVNDLIASKRFRTTKKKLLKNSLYENLLKNNAEYEGINPHLFADTHSYFGIHTEYPERKVKGKASIRLKTQIEWQVKPGHFQDLLKILKKEVGDTVFSRDNFMLTGKTDYYIQERQDLLENNIKLLQAFKKNPEIFDYARKVKTRVMFSQAEGIGKKNPHHFHHPHFIKWLREKGIIKDKEKLHSYSQRLKQLKISRNVRNKINKIYYNYNNGIQDPVMFTYFLDFSIFIENLTQLIEDEHTKFEAAFRSMENWEDFEKTSVNETENTLLEKIEIFDEGYRIRMLNCHNYEDITDFDLDFNSSVQQLLTTYNTISAFLGNLFFEPHSHGPVVQLYLKNTVSNYETINYDVYHLTSPEFVFFTLAKEILNKFTYANEVSCKQANREEPGSEVSVRDIIRGLESEVRNTRLRDYFDNDLINFEYYFLDSIKFIQTCNLDFELYQYWFWTYNFQNAALYDRIGTFNEDHFKKELTRLVFLARLFKIPFEKITCPLPEIAFLWERHAKSIFDSIEQFFQKSKLISAFKNFMLTTFHYPAYELILQNGGNASQDEISQRYEFLTANLEESDRLSLDHYKGSDLLIAAINTQSNYRKIAVKLENGIPVNCKQKDTEHFYFLNTFIYAYLRLLYEKNKSVRLLRRNWENGEPLKSFIRVGPHDFLYSVDQFGGIFFPNNKSAAEYFKIRNAVLHSLWHFSLLYKKQMLNKLIIQ